MTKRRIFAFVLVAAAGIGGAIAASWLWSGALMAKEVALGRRIYAEHCASCHGASLEGQPDWRHRRPDGRLPAPPHDASGHTWHHSDAVLFRVTKHGPAAVAGGDYESDMPGFEGVLSDAEIGAVLTFIKSTWPERERGLQEQQSRIGNLGAGR